ncbi:tetratricopeptide repeat protein [uncultured Kordia sp.]|uniref:tetratricopeptide repeat protein n=1 Tax=uncultured Kordia sp. TaxID=507699 RepID=UPI00262B3280|nr:tetratricopeptide repeat protein [uncultured Kordia sp.]
MDIKNPNKRLLKSLKLLDQGILSVYNSGNQNLKFQSEYMFYYALFLQNHRFYKKASKYYYKALTIYLKLVDNTNDYQEMLSSMYTNIAIVQANLYDYDQSLISYTEALKIDKELLLKNPEELIYFENLGTSLQNISIAYNDIGKEYESELLLNKSFNYMEKLSKDFPEKYSSSLADAYYNRGVFLNNKGDLKKAYADFKKAEELYDYNYKKLPKENLAEISDVYESLASLYRITDNFEDAINNFYKAKKIVDILYRESPTENIIRTLILYQNFGNLMNDVYSYEKAEYFFSECIKIIQNPIIKNKKHFLIHKAELYNDIGTFKKMHNEIEVSKKYYIKALKVLSKFEKKYTGNSFELEYKIRNNLAILYTDNYLYRKSKKQYLKSLDIFENFLNLGNKKARDYGMILNNLGVCLVELEIYEKAEKHLAKAYKIRTKLVTQNPEANNHDLLTTLINLARLYGDQLLVEKANSFYKRSIKLARKLNNVNDAKYKDTLYNALYNYGIFLKDSNQVNQAELMLTESLSIANQLARANPQAFKANVGFSMMYLGRFYESINKYFKAEKFYIKSIEVFENIQKNQPLVHVIPMIGAYLDYAAFLNHLGKHEKTLTLFRSALKTIKSISFDLPSNYERYSALIFHNIGELYQTLSKPKKAEEYYLKAMKLRRGIAENFLELSETYNSLGVLYSDIDKYDLAKKYLKKARNIRENRVKKNKMHLGVLADTLCNISVLYENTNKKAKALSNYQKTLEIYTSLAVDDPYQYNVYIAGVYVNLSLYYQWTKPNKKKSLEHLKKGILFLKKSTKNTIVIEIYELIDAVLVNWELDPKKYLEPFKY